MSSSHQETNNSPPTTPNMSAKMLQKGTCTLFLSSPKDLSSASATAPIQDSTPPVAQPEQTLAGATPSSSPTQNQQAQTPQNHSTLASNMNAECMDRRSPKRAREEDDDSSSAFGTPPPKRMDSKTGAISNSKATTKKSVSPKRPARKKSAPKNAAAAPTPSRSQPSRNRKAPERFEDLHEKTAPKAPPNKKGASKVFDPAFITTNSGSRLVKADIYHMLLEGPAWTSLSAEQQSTLVSMLPQDSANQALLTRINAGQTEDTRPSAFTLANDCFRTDVAKFQEDLKNGHLAKTWQAAAEQAVIERAAGVYDEWKAEEAEAWWGQKST